MPSPAVPWWHWIAFAGLAVGFWALFAAAPEILRRSARVERVREWRRPRPPRRDRRGRRDGHGQVGTG